MVVEHARTVDQLLGEKQRPTRITREDDPGCEGGRGPQVDRLGHVREVRLRPCVSVFESTSEFREVIDRTFTLMSEDPDMGPRLRDADTPQRFEFTDLDLVVNVRAGAADEPNLVWEWSDDVDWEPRVRMSMSADTANRYFQGKENIAIAIARRRIKTGGDVKAALALIPVTKPLFERYRTMLADDYPHLLA
jgi:hypothetical protein